MDPMLLATLVELLTTAARLTGRLDPAIINDPTLAALIPALPGLVQSGETTFTMLRESGDPTPEEEQQIRAALDAANAALQAS
jgi:hypothetical protein